MIGRTLLIVAGMLLLAASSAFAQTPPAVMLEDLTSPEVAAAVRSGTTTIIVPIGGTEQNGPHMVLGKHNVRVRVLAEKIARTLGNALVAPVLAYVPEGAVQPPAGHMRFAGTITISDRTFEAILESAARSFRQHGFRDIVFIGDHGGYQQDERIVADRLNREWAGTPVRAHAITAYYTATEKQYVDALRSRGHRDAEIGTHAGLADTSLSLAIDPRLVRTERLRSGAAPTAAEGVHGDPRQASATLGQLGVDAIVTATVNAIRKATVRH